MENCMTSQNSNYCLEHENEFDRLEFQSSFPKYDFKEEFRDFRPTGGQNILDAGSGSGIVLRHYAEQYPECKYIGCDMSAERVNEARNKSKGISHLSFQTEDLRSLSFQDSYFDFVLSRYVVEHVPKADIQNVMKEIYRVLKPGGEFICVDFDGPLFNIYPRSPIVDKVLSAFQESPLLDLWIGRKIPHLMHQAGFSQVKWRIETVECHGEALEHEFQLLPEKFDRISDFIGNMFNDSSIASQFKIDYLKILNNPGTVLYYNKFVVSGKKSHLSIHSSN